MSIIYHHTLPSFEHYFQPETVNEAVDLLHRYGKGARILAGGTDLLVLMRSRSLAPNCIVDINRLTGLAYLDFDSTSSNLKIGALVTLRAVELSTIVQKHYPLLYDAVSQMASTQVRHMGTVVGNICRASPAADTAPPLLALGARVEIAGLRENRTVPLTEFFIRPGKTVLKHNEMVTGIQVPKLPANTGTAFLRVSRVAADLAKASVASVLTFEGNTCQDVRIALGAVAPTPVRAGRAEDFLKGKRLEAGAIEKAAELAAEESSPISDVRSTEDYRKEIIKVLVSRAVKICQKRAQEKTRG